jgi:putative aminopeptidase FrvX
MLSAHMDVIYELAADSQLVKNGSIWSRSEGILGADDRAGIAMILILLDELPTQGFNGTIKVAFTVQEETGQKGAVKLDSSFYKDVKMAVSLDRRNGNDIVIRSNGSKTYGPEELGKLFETASKELWNGENNYIITNGGVSDLRVWSAEGVPSLNLSVGFRNEHTPYETLDIEEWRRTRQLVLHVLTTKKIGKFIFTQGENNVGV